ncbi:MAG: Gfo/Idh/MocA family protein [Thermoguttaceae bacterium]
MKRRKFLQLATSASFVPYLMTSERPSHAEATSDRLRFALIGLGGQGRWNGKQLAQMADIAALCDVDSERISQTANELKLTAPVQEKDYRKILDRKDIDAVSISTVDHWHVKIAMDALRAGKHVFCEKPLTLTIQEGQLIRKVANQFPKQVFQVGTQQRAHRDQFALAALMIRKGLLGKVQKITANIGGSPSKGPLEKQSAPASLDWDFWQGQCKSVEYIKERCFGTFRYWYEYSGGTLTDWGAHHVDFALWALGQTSPGTGPVKITPIRHEHPVPFKNGMPEVDNCFNTSTQFTICSKFSDGVELTLTSDGPDGNGVLVEGTEGRIHVNRSRIRGKAIDEGWHTGIIGEQDFDALANGKPYPRDFTDPSINHKSNFIRCIREGGIPLSDVESHVQTMFVCHLSAIAARLGREISWDPSQETVLGDDQAAAFLSYSQRKGFEVS